MMMEIFHFLCYQIISYSNQRIMKRDCLSSLSLDSACSDFGLAMNLSEERAVTRLGTLDYMAPEVLRCPDKYLPGDNKERADLAYNEAVDSWAMGVLAYELIVGRPPFGMVSAEFSCPMELSHECFPHFSRCYLNVCSADGPFNFNFRFPG